MKKAISIILMLSFACSVSVGKTSKGKYPDLQAKNNSYRQKECIEQTLVKYLVGIEKSLKNNVYGNTTNSSISLQAMKKESKGKPLSLIMSGVIETIINNNNATIICRTEKAVYTFNFTKIKESWFVKTVDASNKSLENKLLRSN